MNKRGRHPVAAVVSVSVLGAAVALGAASASSGASASGSAPQPAPMVDQAKVQSVVLAMAAQNGDRSPSSIRDVQADRTAAVANSDPGAQVVRDGPVPVAAQLSYLAVAQGNFTGLMAKRPPGAPPPTGHVLSVVIDAQTGEVADWGISDDQPALKRLGTVAKIR